MGNSCPVCKVGLVGKSFDSVGLEECPRCGGVWILEERLKSLEAKGIHELDRLDAEDAPTKEVVPDPSAKVCPGCGKVMDRFHFMLDTPIMLERCDDCEGLWIDHGELTQMAAAIDEAHKPVTAKESSLAAGAGAEERFEERHGESVARVGGISGALGFLSRRWLF